MKRKNQRKSIPDLLTQVCMYWDDLDLKAIFVTIPS